MRFFSRRHRCITYSARGYKPSDVPKDWKDYSLQALGRATRSRCSIISRSTRRISSACRWAATRRCMLGLHLSRPRAVVDRGRRGLRLRARPHRGVPQDLRRRPRDEFGKQGLARGGEGLWPEPGAHFVPGQGPARLRRVQQDVRRARRAGLRATPCAASRPSGRRSTISRPRSARSRCRRLIVVGDEDEPCLEPSFLLKQWIRPSGLVVLPKTGHVVNQEEPALFNEAVADFIARVEAGRWPARDPRSIGSSRVQNLSSSCRPCAGHPACVARRVQDRWPVKPGHDAEWRGYNSTRS